MVAGNRIPRLGYVAATGVASDTPRARVRRATLCREDPDPDQQEQQRDVEQCEKRIAAKGKRKAADCEQRCAHESVDRKPLWRVVEGDEEVANRLRTPVVGRGIAEGHAE